jgi:hypothetical protein
LVDFEVVPVITSEGTELAHARRLAVDVSGTMSRLAAQRLDGRIDPS